MQIKVFIINAEGSGIIHITIQTSHGRDTSIVPMGFIGRIDSLDFKVNTPGSLVGINHIKTIVNIPGYNGRKLVPTCSGYIYRISQEMVSC